MKVCTKCNVLKELKDFTVCNKHKDGLSYKCRVCSKAYDRYRYNRDWTKRTKLIAEYAKTQKGRAIKFASALKFNYKISVEEYAWMMNKQGNKCAICNEQETDSRKHYLSVDHCHKTGKIRGLLCKQCNIGIENFKDSTGVLTGLLSI